MEKIENKSIKEEIYIEKLENGLDIIIIPKKGFLQKSVMFGTKFGSINSKFKVDGEIEQVPDGVAHFLEHKVFEQESGEDALMTLVALGANPNAYTTSDHTVYFFDTIDNFDKCMDELFNFVQSPYFTDENVEKEQGIIGQEIQMYDDHDSFQLYISLLQNLYVNHPIRIDTAGTIESISHITKEILYKCYNTFYDISNMVVCICGDVDPIKMIEKVKGLVPKTSEKKEIQNIFDNEPISINKKESIKYMTTNTPLFAIGFKDNNVANRSPKKRILFDIATQIALNLLVGKSSDLYNELYNENLITEDIEISYNYESNYGFAMLEGYSSEPEKVVERIKNKLGIIINEITQNDFDRIRKNIKGTFLFDFNNVPKIARMVFADYIKGINTLEYIDKYDEITLEDVKDVYRELMIEDNMAISYIKGK